MDTLYLIRWQNFWTSLLEMMCSLPIIEMLIQCFIGVAPHSWMLLLEMMFSLPIIEMLIQCFIGAAPHSVCTSTA